jgi:hypothetical protein
MALLGYTADLLDDQSNYVLYEIAPLSSQDMEILSLIEMFDSTLEDIIDREANPENMVLLGEGGVGGGGINESIPEQYIRGRVVDIEGDGCARVVIAIDRATGARLAITTSDPAGGFTLRPRTLDPCILVAVPISGEQLNAVVLDNILPVPE